MKKRLLMIPLIALGAFAMNELRQKKSVSAALPQEPRLAGKSWAEATTPVPSPPPAAPSLASFASSDMPASPSRTMPSFDKPYQYFHQRLIHLNSCLKSSRCAYPQKDPKSYETAVYNDLAGTLRTLRHWQRRHNYVDGRIPLLMKKFLTYDHSDIKIEALEILATQPVNPSLFRPLLRDVIDQPNPDAIALGMRELARFEGAAERERMDAVFIDLLMQGSVHGAAEVAKHLSVHIDEDNRYRYEAALKDLRRIPLSEEISDNLQVSLKTAKN